MILLSVDWDFFFRTHEYDEEGDEWYLYDWGHKEGSNLLTGVLWYSRASAFDRAGTPRPGLTGEQRDFWDRFKFHYETEWYVADSHSRAAAPEVMRRISTVWNYDAHHDAGYKGTVNDIAKREMVTCEDWMVAYWMQGAKLHQSYPSWRYMNEPKPLVPVTMHVDEGKRRAAKVDRVFICRSGSWVPPWLDQEFDRFLRAAPGYNKMHFMDAEHWDVVREWDEKQVEALTILHNTFEEEVEE